MKRDLTTEQHKLIEAQLLGRLSKEEKVLFDSYQKEDPLFLEEYEFQLAVKKALQYQDTIDFSNQLKKIESQYSGKTSKLRFWWPYVAAAVFLVGALMVLSRVWIIEPHSELVVIYFEPQTNIHYPITRSSQDANLRDRAFFAYESQEWERAGILFDSLMQVDKSADILFYRSNLLMIDQAYEEAIPLLEDFRSSGDLYSDRALWYLALSHLGLGNTAEAVGFLEEIIKTNGYPTQKARDLLEEIRSL